MSHSTQFRSFRRRCLNVFTGQMTQPTVSKHWRRVVSYPDSSQSHQAHLTMLQYYTTCMHIQDNDTHCLPPQSKKWGGHVSPLPPWFNGLCSLHVLHSCCSKVFLEAYRLRWVSASSARHQLTLPDYTDAVLVHRAVCPFTLSISAYTHCAYPLMDGQAELNWVAG